MFLNNIFINEVNNSYIDLTSKNSFISDFFQVNAIASNTGKGSGGNFVILGIILIIIVLVVITITSNKK